MPRNRRWLLLGVLAVAACGEADTLIAPPPSDPPAASIDQRELTPYQQSVQTMIAEREAQGLPVPEVSFTYVSDIGAPLSALQGFPGMPGDSFTIVATTTLEFDSPREAGFDVWPASVVRGEVNPDEGFIREGDYSDEARDYLAERSPGVWSRHQFGFEPRTQTITETVTVTYPLVPHVNDLVDDDLVHGRTITGPNIDWTVTNEACVEGVCAWYFKAGFEVDWGFGIRLPMNVTLDSPAEVNEGDTFVPTSVATGVNWSASDYVAAGLPAESGNEFVMRFTFFLGVTVEVAGIEVLGVGPNIDEDESSSFSSPFGPGAVFDLPTIDAPIKSWSVSEASASFGVAITPKAGSDRFKANWNASSGMSGNGSLVYTNPASAENLSVVSAIDGPSTGNLRINNTKYVFTQFKVGLGAFFKIDIFGLFDKRYEIPITDFNLSSVIPDITVPIHPGSSPTALNASVQVRNVAPTAEINVGGAQVINGVDTFFADVGESVPFEGSSQDPGADDLTVEWDFGDGSPAPDASTLYPLGAAVGPNNVTDPMPHVFAEACAYQVTFTSTDSDGASSQDAAAVIIRAAAGENRVRMSGYWSHQLRGTGNVDYTEDELTCLLDVVEAMSTVFHEERDASTVPLAFDVVDLRGNHGSEAEKLDRELLVAWLNFANGAFELDDPVDLDGDGVGDTTFGAVMTDAETMRRDPAATADELTQQRDIVHAAIAP